MERDRSTVGVDGFSPCTHVFEDLLHEHCFELGRKTKKIEVVILGTNSVSAMGSVHN